jgi:signal transduction histidine kinase
LRQRLGNIAILEERERIARDLHDRVIQRLFAAGMTLQTALPLTARAEVATRIAQSIEHLDETIREIRLTIFALTQPTRRSLRVDIFSHVDDARETLGFSPELKLDGPIDTVVTDELTDHLLATLQEALSNVGKHANASKVDVFVEAHNDLVLRVEDDGVGLPGELARKSGLENMRKRAENFGGSFTAQRATEGGGTLVEWRVPLA